LGSRLRRWPPRLVFRGRSDSDAGACWCLGHPRPDARVTSTNPRTGTPAAAAMFCWSVRNGVVRFKARVLKIHFSSTAL
jgi:hypothetical protein